MTQKRITFFVLAIAFASYVMFPNATLAQEEVAGATPVAGEVMCTFPADAPLVISGAEYPVQAGDGAIEIETTFDENCVPTSTVSWVPVDQEETAAGSPRSLRLAPGWGVGGARARFTTMSSVCHASLRTHDVAHITLTHSHTYAKWYYDGTNNTGRSFSSSSTSEDHLGDGWSVNDGPWFFWYYLSDPVGAEGWTGFEWLYGLYAHELRAILWMYGYGGCYANFYVSGSLCACIHVHTRYYVNGG